MEEMLTVEEISALLKVRVTTVRHWLRNGHLNGHKYGKSWRVPQREVAEWGRRPRPAEQTVPTAARAAPSKPPEAVQDCLEATRKAARRVGLRTPAEVERLVDEVRAELQRHS